MGAAGAGAVAVGAAGFGVGHQTAAADADPTSTGIEPFYGLHQAGIATAQQDRLLFAAYDLTTASSGRRRQLLQRLDGGRGAA